MPMGWIAAAQVVSGAMGARAAEKAAATQAAGQREAAAINKQMFDITNEQQRPYREAGYTALSDIAGMKPYLTNQFTAEDFAQNIDPGFAFRLKLGQEQAERMANKAGGFIGGNALTGLQDYTQGQASQEYGNAFNRYQEQRKNIYNTLASIAGLGQTSVGQTTQSGVLSGANIGSAIGNAASAQAAGTIGAANAIGGAAQNLGNQYYLSQLLKPQGQTFNNSTGWSGGGSGMVNVPGQGEMPIGDYFRAA